MGLDTYAAYPKTPEEDKYKLMEDSMFPANTLVGGMFSGSGNSFRGKVYNDYVEHVTGISLYQEVIPNHHVHRMADLLEEAIPNFRKLKAEQNFHINLKESYMLAEWFRTVANQGGVVLGWW